MPRSDGVTKPSRSQCSHVVAAIHAARVSAPSGVAPSGAHACLERVLTAERRCPRIGVASPSASAAAQRQRTAGRARRPQWHVTRTWMRCHAQGESACVARAPSTTRTSASTVQAPSASISSLALGGSSTARKTPMVWRWSTRVQGALSLMATSPATSVGEGSATKAATTALASSVAAARCTRAPAATRWARSRRGRKPRAPVRWAPASTRRSVGPRRARPFPKKKKRRSSRSAADVPGAPAWAPETTATRTPHTSSAAACSGWRRTKLPRARQAAAQTAADGSPTAEAFSARSAQDGSASAVCLASCAPPPSDMRPTRMRAAWRT